jgi:hypothetical protein
MVNSMPSSCLFSFDDLYRAAFGRSLSDRERQELYALPQAQRNAQVGEWAKRARWRVADRRGTDGVEYRAFWPAED